MSQLSWKDAIEKVLGDADQPLHYTEIAHEIARRELRTAFGATPASSVNATISVSIKDDGEGSPFVRRGKGHYALGRQVAVPTPLPALGEEETKETGLVRAFGMYWRRDKVDWRPRRPRLSGHQEPSTVSVDFGAEQGVYLLHDIREVVYVGQTVRPLGVRLREHTKDRLDGRWDRFSWFGVFPAREEGELDESVARTARFDLDTLITTLEAVLIEGLEPRQNKQRDQAFNAIEYVQVEDPEIRKRQERQLFDELGSRLGL